MKKFIPLVLIVTTISISHGQNTWVQKANVGSIGRYAAVMFSIGNKGYCATGYNGSSYTNDLWEYDPSNNTWTQKANFGGAARFGASAFSVGGKGYVGTGLDATTRYSDFWEYDPSTNIWTARANFPGPVRYAATALSIGNKGYLGLGGYSATGPMYDDFYEYDPSTNVWTQKANFIGAARANAAGFTVGSKCYMGVGSNSAINAIYNDWFEYDPATNSWNQKASLPAIGRRYPGTFSIGNSGFLGCGFEPNSNTYLNDFWEYTPSNDTWTQRANFPGTNRSTCGMAINGYGYLGTGYSSGPTVDFWQYTPLNNLTSTFTSTGNTCYGGNDGSATVTASGGTSPYTYSWAPSGGTNATATGLPAGTYTCTVTDAMSATYQQIVTITQPAPISINVSTIAASGCTGTGSATASVTGGTSPYSYNWSSGGTGITENNLPVGNYTITVTDNSSCTNAQTCTITNASPPIITSTQTDISCNGGANGAALVSITGGAGPFTYSWSPFGGNNASASGLSAGSYTCSVTDANGCPFQQVVTLTEPTALAATSLSTGIQCFGGTASASVAVSGGTPAYTYTWSPSGGNGQNATGLTAGTYLCTITDLNGCLIQQTITITQPSNISVAVIGNNLVCYGAQNGSAVASAIGGNPGYTYNWTPSGGTSQNANGLGAGTYTITVTDANGCTGTNTVAITQPSQVTGTESHTNESFSGSSDGSATVSATGGNGPYSYLWAPAGGTNATATGLTAGTYTCTITDANGCTGSVTVTIISLDGNGIDPHDNNALSVTIFPNPSHGLVNIEIQSSSHVDPYVEVYDALGNKIKDGKLISVHGTYHIYDIHDLVNGVYLFRIIVGDNTSTQIVTVVE